MFVVVQRLVQFIELYYHRKFTNEGTGVHETGRLLISRNCYGLLEYRVQAYFDDLAAKYSTLLKASRFFFTPPTGHRFGGGKKAKGLDPKTLKESSIV